MNRIINAFVIYQFIRLLIKPFDQTDAFKLGIIDADGNYLKKQGDLKTPEEKKASNIFTRLVWNIKKILNKVPLVRSKLGTFATALYLIREQAEYIGADAELIETTLVDYFRRTHPGIIAEMESLDFSDMKDGFLIENLELSPIGSFMNIPMFRIEDRVVSAIELQEVAVNAAGGVIGGGAVQPESPTIKGYDTPLAAKAGATARMFRRKPVFNKEDRDVFLGKNVYEMENDDYFKCMNGRTRYERWGRKINAEDIEHQELRKYMQKFGEAIIKNKTTGEMTYFRTVRPEEV